jgi:Ca-activated chloride channel family protein
MSFAQPIFLYALVLVPFALAFLLWAESARRKALSRIGQPNLVQRLTASVNVRGRYWKYALWLGALALLLVALARPQWGETRTSAPQKGVQVMVALDVSKSMLAEDLKPNRLTRAKMEISELMSRLKGDEIGLVPFSGASFILFPLTSDYNTARSFLETANPGIVSRGGTAIGDAIRTALNGFDPNRNSQKVIVVVTDGEDT